MADQGNIGQNHLTVGRSRMLRGNSLRAIGDRVGEFRIPIQEER